MAMTNVCAEDVLRGAEVAKTDERRARAPRISIARTERFMFADRTPAERKKICDDAYRIHDAYFPGVDRELLERGFFGDDSTRVFLYYGADGALAGFGAVSMLWVNHEGRDHAVFKGVTCIDARYKFVWRARLPSIVEALRFKISHPRTPVAYMGMATTPTGYRLFASTVPRCYPSRHMDTPAAIKALLLKATCKRGFEPVDEDKLLVRAVSRLANPERLREALSLQDDPDVRFYLDRNPRLGEHAMLFWVPLDLDNVCRGAARILKSHFCGEARSE
jgi:hypothetical protein